MHKRQRRPLSLPFSASKRLTFWGPLKFGAAPWSFEDQLDPGTYYVMMQAIDYDCIGQPDCIGGYSNMLTLTVRSHRRRTGAASKFSITSTWST